MKLTPQLREVYGTLYRTFKFDARRMAEREYYVTNIVAKRAEYEETASAVNAPWYFVGLIHLMECGLNFRCHLHNGDPLYQRTTRFPPGQPKSGRPPFLWRESAVDALQWKGIDKVGRENWDITQTLYQLERYNGFGYRVFHQEVNSPYLWAGTNHYTRGKYVTDGKFDPNFISKQLGSVPVYSRLLEEDRSLAERTKESTDGR